ncbi:MAG: hypothetical protein V7739_09240 [Motiliproteus sp.]
MDDKYRIFKKIIRAASTQVLVHQLSARNRWHLMLDVLRGTAPFRGGRIRDFPLSEQRVSSEYLIELLSRDIRTGTPRKYSASGNYSLFDQITAVMLLEMATRSSQKYFGDIKDEDTKYTTAIIALALLVFDDEICQKNAALQMGVSLFEWERLKNKKYVKKLFNDSASLAVFANYKFESTNYQEKRLELIEHFNVDAKVLDIYDSFIIDIIYLKTRNVQKFLDNCKTHFMLRGASFWCSQIMTYARDIICGFSQSSLHIVIDSDSVIIIAGSAVPSRDCLFEKLYDGIIDQTNGRLLNRDLIFGRYPRLNSLWRHCEITGTSMLAALPNIGLDINRGKSLLSMVLDGQDLESKPESRWNNNNTLEFNSGERSAELSAPQCWGVNGEAAFTAADYRIPKWYNSRSKDEEYGSAATIFSLADLTFRHQSLLEFQSWIENEIERPISFSNYSKNIAKELGLKDKLTYLKLDGDSVGKIFSSTPFIARPRLSHLLEESMIHAILKTASDIIEEFEFAIIPLNVLYLGGDDLFLSFPTDLEESLLPLLDRHLGHRLNEKKFTFTFSATRLENTSYSEKGLEFDELQMMASQLLNPLLKSSKAYYKEGVEISKSYSDLLAPTKHDFPITTGDVEYYRGTNLRGVIQELYAG